MDTEISIVIQPTEKIPFVYGDDGSLHCVIAPNGHVWGKFLDGESEKKDVELAIYTPARGGYLWRTKSYMAGHWLGAASMTEGIGDRVAKTQYKKIEIIISQQSVLEKLLGCFHLHSSASLIGNYWRKENRDRNPRFVLYGVPFNTKFVDCSFEKQRDSISYHGFFEIRYDDVACAFFCKAGEHTLAFRSSDEFSGWALAATEQERMKRPNSDKVSWIFDAAQAHNKAFDCYRTDLCKKEFIPHIMHALFNGYNIFDFFAIDDVLLIAEARMLDGQTTITWTVAVAQNQHVRQLERLRSNNPDLLAGK